MEGRIGSKAHGPDQEPSGRGATTRSQVERLRTGLPQQSNRLGGLHADDQVLPVYADGAIPPNICFSTIPDRPASSFRTRAACTSENVTVPARV